MSLLGEPLSILALGLFNGFALCIFVLSLPPLRKPTLSSRIAPYLRDQESLVDIYAPPTPRTEGFWGLVKSWLVSSTLWVTSRITTDATLRLRIDRLGGNATIERFRINQVLSILVGMIVAGGLAGALSAQRGFSPIVTLVLVISGGIAGHVVNDWRLSQAIARHESRVLAEFPTVAELLALSITAGEGIVEALERVCRTCSGDLIDELRAALAATRTGTPLVEALDAMATRIAIPEIVQFVDGLAVSMTRGTPLAEVLRSQAADVREQSRRRLLELSGRKEIGMLVPVVVFVLPVTVIFAVFPSLTVLDLSPQRPIQHQRPVLPIRPCPAPTITRIDFSTSPMKETQCSASSPTASSRSCSGSSPVLHLLEEPPSPRWPTTASTRTSLTKSTVPIAGTCPAGSSSP